MGRPRKVCLICSQRHIAVVCPNPPDNKQDTEPAPPPPPRSPPPPPPPPPPHSRSPPPADYAPPPRPPPQRPQTSYKSAPQSVLVLKAQGYRAFTMGLFEKAILKYDEAIGMFDLDHTLFGMRGKARFELKRHQSALEDFQRSVSLQGDVAMGGTFLRIGRCLCALGQPAPATIFLRRALDSESHTDPADADVVRAFVKKAQQMQSHMRDYHGAYERGHYRMAKTAHQACLDAVDEQGGQAPLEWICWGIDLQIARGEWEDAHEAVDQELRVKDKAPELWLRKGLVLFLSGKLDEAASALLTALKMDHDNVPARRLRARVKEVKRLKSLGNDHFREERWADALSAYDECLETIEAKAVEGGGGLIRATLLSNRAATLMKASTHLNDRLKAAMADVQAALELVPTYVKALRTRARINTHNEDYESAIEDYKSAMAHATPSEKRALQNELDDVTELFEDNKSKPKDYYAILGVSCGCNAKQLRKAYLELSRVHHPDKASNLAKPLRAEKFKLIAEAWGILSDPDQRAEYDVSHGFY
ncbi:DnaJ domain-containing protein [Peniophora sp. CONT]|nr:DnaJ domain-containing protein [Peniophora sp. CONT]